MKISKVSIYIYSLLIACSLFCAFLIFFFIRTKSVEKETDSNTKDTTEVLEECDSIVLENIQWGDVYGIKKVTKGLYNDIVLYLEHEDTSGVKEKNCVSIGQYFEKAHSVPNSSLAEFSNVIYLEASTVAYLYKETIFILKIEENPKIKIVVDKDMALKKSVQMVDSELITRGPFVFDAISDKFFFIVDFTFDCETPEQERSCDEMGLLKKELVEKEVIGLWMYSGGYEGNAVYLSSQILD